MASYLGFNAIINVAKSHHTEGMTTQGTEYTDTEYKTKRYLSPSVFSTKDGWSFGVSSNKVVDGSSSTTTINTQTTINNVFTLKGTLALIGKENQANGEEFDEVELNQHCVECYKCVSILQRVYWPNQELKMIAENNIKPLGGIIIGIVVVSICMYFFSLITGSIIFGIYFLVSLGYYNITKNNENEAYEMLAPVESELKDLVDKYGEGLFDIYQLSPYIALKHVGE